MFLNQVKLIQKNNYKQGQVINLTRLSICKDTKIAENYYIKYNKANISMNMTSSTVIKPSDIHIDIPNNPITIKDLISSNSTDIHLQTIDIIVHDRKSGETLIGEPTINIKAIDTIDLVSFINIIIPNENNENDTKIQNGNCCRLIRVIVKRTQIGVPYIKLGDFSKIELKSSVKTIIDENLITNIGVIQMEDDIIKMEYWPKETNENMPKKIKIKGIIRFI